MSLWGLDNNISAAFILYKEKDGDHYSFWFGSAYVAVDWGNMKV